VPGPSYGAQTLEQLVQGIRGHPNTDNLIAAELARRHARMNERLAVETREANGRLLFASWAVVVLTVVLVAMTGVLIWLTTRLH
jgi:hypothetical protein